MNEDTPQSAVEETLPAPPSEHPPQGQACAGIAGRFEGQPKELGYLLLTAGAIGFVLPGPGTPAFIAGGLILWPKRFGQAESWFQKRFPSLHQTGLAQIERYLSDLETRYPGSTSDEPVPPTERGSSDDAGSR